MIGPALTTLYLLAAGGLAVYGLLGLLTLALYWRHRRDAFPCPPLPTAALPSVTVQLPIYNEKYVVGRLIDAAAGLDYPADRLQIQVVDDSTDETTAIAAGRVAAHRARGVDISLVHRPGRDGYKAGALGAALPAARGDFVAIFDADFQPPPDFLRRTAPHLAADPALGMIQARWAHLNAGDSPLTAAQAIALDKHFAMEQTVRHRADLFPKFNGAAGIWRRACIEDAGGWQADTVCEDLCLSTRAILRGWQFRFLNDVVAPAELPVSIAAYKNQQARWAQGSMQCLLKFGGAIWRSSRHSIAARLYALLSMSAYITHPLLLLLLLLQLPLLWLDQPLPPALAALGLAGVGQPLLFILGQQALYPDWLRRLRHFPTLLLMAVGIAPSNSRALLGALQRGERPFVRTPKRGTRQTAAGYHLPFDPIILAEAALAVYALAGVGLALWRGAYGSLFLPATCALGLGYVLWLGAREMRAPTADG